MSSFRVSKTFQEPICTEGFENLARSLVHQDGSNEQKLETLFRAKAFFNAEQAGHLISTFRRPKDKVKAVMILEPKLVPISCQEARSILANFFIPEDRLQALEYVKRSIYDANTQEGVDNILFTFTFPEHKIMAARIMKTIMNRPEVLIAAGGHQGYSALGNLYTNGKPNNTHIYGDQYDQVQHLPNHRQARPNMSTGEGGGDGGGSYDYPTSQQAETIYNGINTSNLAESRSDYVGKNQYLKRAEYLDTNKLNTVYDSAST